MSKLVICKELNLPLDLVTESVGLLAKRRAGKSTTARKMAEALHHAGQQVSIVDPKGDWWGIRYARNGKDPGLPFVILGGEHGDIPLEVHSGELVARMVVQQCVSVVIDLSKFRKNELTTFMTAYMETLYRMKAAEQYRTPLMQIIDEADAIAPQKPFRGEERMLGAAEDLVRRGGQRGIGVMMATQRAAVLNKNVLTQIGMMVWLRTIAPQDMAVYDLQCHLFVYLGRIHSQRHHIEPTIIVLDKHLMREYPSLIDRSGNDPLEPLNEHPTPLIRLQVLFGDVV